MRILPVGLIAGALSLALLLPAAGVRAQDWPDDDMQGDAYAIQQGRRELRHDRHELHEDLERGDLGAAAHEEAEMAQRRYNLEQRQQDLNNDIANRYYGPYGYGPYQHDDDD